MVKFGALSSGNLSNKVRGSDTWGEGHYGALRDGGKRKHMGMDIECEDGAIVCAPFDVVLNGRSRPYTDPKKAAINDGVNVHGEGLSFKLWYVKPDKYSGEVKKGQRIGVMLPMQSVYQGITSHIHVQMSDKSDPTQYF